MKSGTTKTRDPALQLSGTVEQGKPAITTVDGLGAYAAKQRDGARRWARNGRTRTSGKDYLLIRKRSTSLPSAAIWRKVRLAPLTSTCVIEWIWETNLAVKGCQVSFAPGLFSDCSTL